ncbi:MAG: serine/threonine-protein kinase [Pirellulaceae bacterium]
MSEDPQRRMAPPATDDTTPTKQVAKSSIDDQSLRTTRFASPASATPPANGRAEEGALPLPRIPGYSISHELARGGMGRVLSGIELELDREVAIKVVLASSNTDAEQRFIAEAKITARLPHPGIPPIYSLGTTSEGQAFLAMKLVRGQTMADQLRQRSDSTVDLGHWLEVFERICQAVGFAHSQNIVHRDLKPSNVMVGAFGEVQVMDWGLAKALESHDESTVNVADESRSKPALDYDSPQMTQAGSVLGTPAFMAPEQARGEVVDVRADVFSLGSIFSMILAGQPAFQGSSAIETIKQAARGDLSDAFIRLDQSTAHPELIAIAKACLSPAPKDRPLHALAVAEAIASYRAGVEQRLQQARQEAAMARIRESEQSKRRRLWIAAAGVVAIVLVIGVVGTGIGLDRANHALIKANESNEVANGALRRVTEEQQRTRQTLSQLQASRERNIRNLSSITDDLVESRLTRQSELSDADRALINGLLPMWQEVAFHDDDDLKSLATRADGHYRVARLNEWLGERDSAEAQFREAIGLRKQLIEQAPNEADYRRELALAHNSYAIFLRDNGELGSAEEHYRSTLDEVTRLVTDHPENISFQQDHAGWSNNLARLLARSGRPEQALELFNDSLATRRKLVELEPERGGFLRDLAESLNNRALLWMSLGQPEKTAEDLNEALAVRERLVELYPEDSEYRQHLASSYNNAGALAMNLGQPEVAVERLRQSLEIKEKLVLEFPTVPRYREELATAASNLGGVLATMGRFDEAESLLAFGNGGRGIGRRESFGAEYRMLWAQSLNNKGTMLIESGKYEDAREAINESLALKLALTAEFPNDSSFREQVPPNYINLAISHTRQCDDSSDAATHLAEAIRCLEQAVEAGWSDAETLFSQPDLEPLRSEEPFLKLLRDLGWEPLAL